MITRNSISFFTLLMVTLTVFGQDPGAEYIDRWKQFYPSRALGQGMHFSIFNYENLSPRVVNDWIEYNQELLNRLDNAGDPFAGQNPIDARLLRIQAASEIDKWTIQAPHISSLSLYAGLIGRSSEGILQAEYLLKKEKDQLLVARLDKVADLCKQAVLNLENVPLNDLDRGLRTLKSAATHFRTELPGLSNLNGEYFAKKCSLAADQISQLIDHTDTNLKPKAVSSENILGRDEYARQLRLYTDTGMTPEELADMARTEIDNVRTLISTYSAQYVGSTYPDMKLSNPDEARIIAFRDMERDAPRNGAEYLKFWEDLADAAIEFIEEKKIATLPSFQTLKIVSAPESAGAAARIGWVDSAPPFAPNPVTTLYLPSIPETLPEADKTDFWSSFNKPFNRMIVIHELYPGHYMQIKISRETPHPVRILFPYRPYIEGWATFTERVCLDNGWEEENPLTFIAHLRKRLENANRAYTSVQVHCNGWTEDKVMEFSTNTSLVAPQFAKSLWGRLMRSPMQLTSYYWGGQQFTSLLEAEKERLGEDFVLQEFMDTILKAGAIPIDDFVEILSE